MVVGTCFEKNSKRVDFVKPDVKYEDIHTALKAFIPWKRGKEQQV
jgi:hypothetical protein